MCQRSEEKQTPGFGRDRSELNWKDSTSGGVPPSGLEIGDGA